MAGARVVVLNTLSPFVTGGSEIFAATLVEKLNEAGHRAILVTFPFVLRRFTRDEVLKSCLPWESLNLKGKADVVIPLRFPTWLASHPRKVVYPNHQLRVAYDLYGSPYGPKDTAEHRDAAQAVREKDAALAEAAHRFCVSRNVQQRLRRFNGLDAEVLYHSLRHEGRYRSGDYGDYVLAVGRLVALKRVDLLVDAMARTRTPVRCLIVGDGQEREALTRRIAAHDLEDRVHLLGWVDDDRLLDLYAGALAVYYAPVDEDYGMVTLEAFKSCRPVITAPDAGGVLEFVVDGENGLVVPPDAEAVAGAIDRLYRDRELARRLGRAGAAAVRPISWSAVVRRLEAHF